MNRLMMQGAVLGALLPLHILALASFLTGLFMATSAHSLGVLGSVVLFLGIFGMFFGALIEALLALRLALRWGCLHWQRRGE
jgi:hypothetical protein